MTNGKKGDRVFFDEFDCPCIIITGRGQSKTVIPFLSLRSAYSAEKIKNWRSVFQMSTTKGIIKNDR